MTTLKPSRQAAQGNRKFWTVTMTTDYRDVMVDLAYDEGRAMSAILADAIDMYIASREKSSGFVPMTIALDQELAVAVAKHAAKSRQSQSAVVLDALRVMLLGEE